MKQFTENDIITYRTFEECGFKPIHSKKFSQEKLLKISEVFKEYKMTILNKVVVDNPEDEYEFESGILIVKLSNELDSNESDIFIENLEEAMYYVIDCLIKYIRHDKSTYYFNVISD